MILTLLAAVLAAVPAAPAASPEPEVLGRDGLLAAQKGDDARAEALLEQASRALPHGATLRVELAKARARLGRGAAAIADLHLAAAMGVVPDLSALDTAFAKERDRPAYQAVRRRFEDNRAPLVRSTVAFQLPERDLLPESVAHDPGDGAFYVGSMHKRKIVRVASEGTSRDFIATGRDKLAGVVGMKVDARRRELWACSCNTGTSPPMDPPDAATVGRGAAYRYALPEGRLMATYPFPGGAPANPQEAHCFNDVVLDAKGNAYFSAGMHGVYRYDRGRDAIESFVSGLPSFVNGITLSEDGGTLFLALHTRGILVVDVTTRTQRALALPRDATLNGIDGLYAVGRALIGVQNGLPGVQRVVRAELDEKLERALRVEVLERNHPAYAVPTTGVIVGRDLYYVATSQLDGVDQNGKLLPLDRLRDTVILKLPIG